MEIYSGCENTFIICMYQSQKDHAAYAQMVCKNKIDGFMMVKTTPLEMVLYNPVSYTHLTLPTNSRV